MFVVMFANGGHVRAKIETVADACKAYAPEGSETAERFRRCVYDDPIARVKLDKLRNRHVREWRTRLEATPALVSRAKKGEPVSRKRAASTVNRQPSTVIWPSLGQRWQRYCPRAHPIAKRHGRKP